MCFLPTQYNLVHITVINIYLETTAYAIVLPLPRQGTQRIQIKFIRLHLKVQLVKGSH